MKLLTFFSANSLFPAVLALGLLYSESGAIPLAAQELPADTGVTIELDAVIASVNEKPILLSEVVKRLRSGRQLDLAAASRDVEVRAVLDGVILERLIEEEAKRKQISVADKDIDDYIDAVARRNNLSREGFQEALKGEGVAYDDYRTQVRIELLKARLASAVLKEGITVSDEEVDGYLADHQNAQPSGTSVTLRQILITANGRSPENLETRVNKVKEALADGTDFEEVARDFSDAPQAAQGGLLGTLQEEDLSREIFDAIYGLKDGQVSAPVTTAQGVQIFQVVSRSGEKEAESPERLREEAREALRQRKREGILSTYFENELQKHHSVDKKI